MSPTLSYIKKDEIIVPESVFTECFGIYSDVLTISKQKTLKKLIRHAYIAGTKHENHTEIKSQA